MENREEITVNEKNVICTNCECADMEEITNPLRTMDPLEWLSFITTSAVSSGLIAGGISYIFNCMNMMEGELAVMGYILIGMGMLLAVMLSYDLIAYLSAERYRRDGICVWYVRCKKCHGKYRIVRPLGTVPPWGKSQKASDEAQETAAEVTEAAED